MTLSDEIREPATRIGGPIRSCRTEWFEDKADRVKKLEAVIEAAQDCWIYMFDDLPKKGMKRVRYEQLYEALKELE